MELFDISQEVFSCKVFPGDPSPEKETMLNIKNGDVCNLTAFSMCAHNGTHVDAPYHFFDDGNTIDKVDLDRFIGYAYVAEHSGDITAEDAKKIIVAYEPIWAIGTGKTATPDDANTTIRYIREKLIELYGEDIARVIPIQYGGSVKSSNAKELFGMSDIDGALIGGASLKVDEFAAIVNYDK